MSLSITEEDKAPEIARFCQLGFCYAQIASWCSCSFTSISKVRKAMISGHPLPRVCPHHFGKKTTREAVNFIEEYTIMYPRMSDRELSMLMESEIHLSLSPATVNRIRHAMHFQFKNLRCQQFLTKEQITARTDFAYSILANHINELNIVFSDEARFSSGPDNSNLWRRRGEINSQTTAERSKFPDGFMVYGAIGTNYKSQLVFCDDTIDSQIYWVNLLKSGMFQALDPHDYLFMQDGAPSHTSHQTMQFLQTRCRVLSFWPANSPDLNPIEHIWARMKQLLRLRVAGIDPSQKPSTDCLKKWVQEIWDSFSLEEINAYCSSFTKRLQLVAIHDGLSINPYLHTTPGDEDVPVPSDNVTILTWADMIQEFNPDAEIIPDPIPVDQMEEFSTEKERRRWNPEIDDPWLMQEFAKWGAKWSVIATEMNSSRGQIRYRWDQLKKKHLT